MDVDGLGVRYAAWAPELNLCLGFQSQYRSLLSLWLFFCKELVFASFDRVWGGGLTETRSCCVTKLASHLRSDPLAFAS